MQGRDLVFSVKYQLIRFNTGSNWSVMCSRLCRGFQRTAGLIWDQLIETLKGGFMGRKEQDVTYLKSPHQCQHIGEKDRKKTVIRNNIFPLRFVCIFQCTAGVCVCIRSGLWATSPDFHVCLLMRPCWFIHHISPLQRIII